MIRRCLSYYSSQFFLKLKQKCYQQELTSNKTSNESHLYWKKNFYKNPRQFRINAEFEADNALIFLV